MSGWDVSNVTNMKYMFGNCNFTGTFPDTENNYYTKKSFDDAESIDPETNWYGDISKWDVSKVTNMGKMFQSARNFNGDLSKWDVGNVTNMGNMFRNASKFDRDISEWNVGNVTNMGSMFRDASKFDRDISEWNVGNVTNMDNMFSGTNIFYQNISEWNVDNVEMSISLSRRPFSLSNTSNTRMGIKDTNSMDDQELAAYNTINCMKPVKFRQVSEKLSCS